MCVKLKFQLQVDIRAFRAKLPPPCLSLPDKESVRHEVVAVSLNYRIARKFCGVKFSRKLIRRSFRDFIFADPYQD